MERLLCRPEALLTDKGDTVSGVTGDNNVLGGPDCGDKILLLAVLIVGDKI